MSEETGVEGELHGRRSVIKKAAVAGAVAWTAPTIMSVTRRRSGQPRLRGQLPGSRRRIGSPVLVDGNSWIVPLSLGAACPNCITQPTAVADLQQSQLRCEHCGHRCEQQPASLEHHRVPVRPASDQRGVPGNGHLQWQRVDLLRPDQLHLTPRHSEPRRYVIGSYSTLPSRLTFTVSVTDERLRTAIAGTCEPFAASHDSRLREAAFSSSHSIEQLGTRRGSADAGAWSTSQCCARPPRRFRVASSDGCALPVGFEGTPTGGQHPAGKRALRSPTRFWGSGPSCPAMASQIRSERRDVSMRSTPPVGARAGPGRESEERHGGDHRSSRCAFSVQLGRSALHRIDVQRADQVLRHVAERSDPTTITGPDSVKACMHEGDRRSEKAKSSRPATKEGLRVLEQRLRSAPNW